MIPEDAMVHVTKQFPFSAEKVFAGWTIPDLVERWLFADNKTNHRLVTIDLETGGGFSLPEERNGVRIDHIGKFTELAYPDHLAFSLRSPQHFTGETYVSVFISANRYGCELVLTQTGVEPEKMEARWYIMLQDLEDTLREQQSNKTILPAVDFEDAAC